MGNIKTNREKTLTAFEFAAQLERKNAFRKNLIRTTEMLLMIFTLGLSTTILMIKNLITKGQII